MLDKHKAFRLEGMRQFGFGPDVMKKNKVCCNCGKTCGAGKKYCDQCGTVLPRETLFDLYKSHHLYCPACDTVVVSTSQYCLQCGKSLRRNKTSILSEMREI